MIDISEIRKKYPQYDHLSDEDLASKLHQKFYSNIPIEEFNSKIGIDTNRKNENNNREVSPLNFFTEMAPALGIARDFAQGSIGGLAKAGQNINKAMQYIPGADKASGALRQLFSYLPQGKELIESTNGEIPKIDDETFNSIGSGKADLLNNTAKSVGEYFPMGALGGTSLAGRIAANAATGALESDENYLRDAAIGGTFGALPEIGGLVKKGIGGVKNAFSTSKYANELMETLGKGAKNVEDLWKNLGSDIRSSYEKRLGEATAPLDEVMSNVADKHIYEKHDPFVSTKISDKFLIDNSLEDLKISELQKAFKESPTFENAHKLQSELGHIERQLENNPNFDISKSEEVRKINNARNQLLSHMGGFLEKEGKLNGTNLLGKYNEFRNLYRDTVAPYLSNQKLRNLLKEGHETVKNLHTIFNTPTNIIKKGKVVEGDIPKILKDLPEESKGKILFGKIGANQHKDNIPSLLESITKSRNGYSSYFTPEIEELITKINRGKKNQALGKYALGGGAIGSGIGLMSALSHAINNNKRGQ